MLLLVFVCVCLLQLQKLQRGSFNHTFLKDLFYFILKAEIQREKQRDLAYTGSLHKWLHGQDWAKPNQETVASFVSPMWIQGSKHMDYIPLLSKVHQQRVGWEIMWLQLKPASICDAGIVRQVLVAMSQCQLAVILWTFFTSSFCLYFFKHQLVPFTLQGTVLDHLNHITNQ